MPAGGRNQELASPQHQRCKVVIGFAGGIEPVTVGRPANVRRPQGVDSALTDSIGTGNRTIDISRFVDKPVLEANLLQYPQHRRITAAQWLRLQLVDAFAQLAEYLLQALEETLALGIHLLTFALLRLVHGNTDAGDQQ
ncbi:hypothetical protein D3C72_1136900 [compost metagenome]